MSVILVQQMMKAHACGIMLPMAIKKFALLPHLILPCERVWGSGRGPKPLPGPDASPRQGVAQQPERTEHEAQHHRVARWHTLAEAAQEDRSARNRLFSNPMHAYHVTSATDCLEPGLSMLARESGMHKA